MPRLLFFDSVSGRYVPVLASPIVVDQAAHTITITLDGTTVSSITTLTGTVFAIASPLPGAAALPASPRFTG